MTISAFNIDPIGIIHSPYKEKFAVPRQPGLVEDGGGELQLLPPYNQADAVRGLTQFSHLWLIFIFHHTLVGSWRPTVRPPRLGGNQRMGVFATRSPFRPNPIGMSLVTLEGIEISAANIILRLGSLDLVDGTPIVDIKPYLPFVESVPHAKAGFAQQAPTADLLIYFTEDVECQLAVYATTHPHLRRFITQVLAQDPRPAYKKTTIDSKHYAVHLLEFNVCWRVIGPIAEVFAIDRLER